MNQLKTGWRTRHYCGHSRRHSGAAPRRKRLSRQPLLKRTRERLHWERCLRQAADATIFTQVGVGRSGSPHEEDRSKSDFLLQLLYRLDIERPSAAFGPA